MKRYFFLTALLILVQVIFVAPAEACGRLKLSSVNVAETWGQVDLSSQDLQIQRSDNKPCTFFVTFTPGQSHSHSKRVARHGGHTIGYQLYGSPFRNDGQMLRSFPGPVQSSNVLSGAFVSGQSGSQRRMNYYFGVNPDLHPTDFPAAGEYHDSFIISLYQGNIGPNVPPDDQVQVDVRLWVPKMISISLVPSGAGFIPGQGTHSMDFGELHQGAAQDFDLRVMTNASYTVSFSSLNNGVLRHTNKKIETTVPYAVQVDSAAKNLNSSRGNPVLVAEGSQHSGVQNLKHNVQVTIGTTTGKMAGDYSDVITVLATTIE